MGNGVSAIFLMIQDQETFFFFTEPLHEDSSKCQRAQWNFLQIKFLRSSTINELDLTVYFYKGHSIFLKMTSKPFPMDKASFIVDILMILIIVRLSTIIDDFYHFCQILNCHIPTFLIHKLYKLVTP